MLQGFLMNIQINVITPTDLILIIGLSECFLLLVSGNIFFYFKIVIEKK